MAFQVRVRVVASRGFVPLPGARVSLYDRDRRSADDRIADQVTGPDGIAVFSLPISLDQDEAGIPGASSALDLYTVVRAPDGTEVVATRDAVRFDAPSGTVITAVVDFDVAVAKELILRKPEPDADKRRQRLRGWFEKRVAEGPGPGDLCVATAILDGLSGLDSPKTDFHKAIVKELRSRRGFKKKDLAAVATYAQKASKDLAAMDLGPSACSGDDPAKHIYKFFSQSGGPLGAITQAIEYREPSPLDGLPPEGTPGLPFTKPFKWRKDCLTKYIQEHGGTHPPEQPVLEQPRVNCFEVWDPLRGRTHRRGEVALRRLEIGEYDSLSSEGWGHRPIVMDMPFNSPEAFVEKTDETRAPFRQIFFTDIGPGKVVSLFGAGFVAGKARLHAQRFTWAENGPAHEGRLVTSSTEPVSIPGWNAPGNDAAVFPVYGADAHEPDDRVETFRQDAIIFEWPRQLGHPGLYRVWFEFENQTDPRIPTNYMQGPDCRLEPDFGPIQSRPLWFAVLPPAAPRMVNPKIAQVVCEDETDPESFGPIPYFDEIAVNAGIEIRQFKVRDDMEPLLFSRALEPFSAVFWSTGDSWAPNQSCLAESHELQIWQYLQPAFLAAEVYGEADKTILCLVLSAAYVAFMLLLFAVLSLAMIALLAGVLAVFVYLEIITLGAATAIAVAALPEIFAVISALATLWFGVLIPGGLAAISLIVDNLPVPADVMAVGTLPVHGAELAHVLSPYRFRRMLWTGHRPARLEGPVPVDVSTSISGNTLTETYTGSNAGGRYAVTLEVDAQPV